LTARFARRVGPQLGEEWMFALVWHVSSRNWQRLAAVDRSFEAVCLFSSLGIVLSLAFFSGTLSTPDPGFMLARVP
jgi:hypothetical protein